jgi:hypothetical protein
VTVAGKFTRLVVPALSTLCALRAETRGVQLQFLESAKPLMVDCAPYSLTPCFRIQIGLTGGGRFSGSEERLIPALTVRIDEQAGTVFYAQPPAGTVRGGRRYALILIDISGSMKTKLPSGLSRFDAAKSAAKVFLQDFDSDRDRVAVVPFESHQVIPRIRAARFGVTKAEVERQIDALPPPASGNTALFAAVSVALDRLSEMKKANPTADTELVLLTDGENDVQSGDDRELSSPEYQFLSLTDRIKALTIPIFAVGLGSLRENAQGDLQQIAGEPHTRFTQDGEGLQSFFAEARQAQTTERLQVTLKAAQQKSQFAGQNHTIDVSFHSAGQGTWQASTTWTPRDLGEPGFESTLEPAEVSAAIKRLSPQTAPLTTIMQPILVFLVWSAALLVFRFVMPRFIWPELYAERYQPAGPPSLAGLTMRASGAAAGARSAPTMRSRDVETVVTDRRSETRTRLK